MTLSEALLSGTAKNNSDIYHSGPKNVTRQFTFFSSSFFPPLDLSSPYFVVQVLEMGYVPGRLILQDAL
jgi:hypothetical protein